MASRTTQLILWSDRGNQRRLARQCGDRLGPIPFDQRPQCKYFSDKRCQGTWFAYYLKEQWVRLNFAGRPYLMKPGSKPIETMDKASAPTSEY
jgi:hypothetical protein